MYIAEIEADFQTDVLLLSHWISGIRAEDIAISNTVKLSKHVETRGCLDN